MGNPLKNFGIFAQELESYLTGVNILSKTIDALGIAEFVIKTYSDSHDEVELKNDIVGFISQAPLFQNFEVLSSKLVKKSQNSREILVKIKM